MLIVMLSSINAEWRVFALTKSVIMLNVIMLSVVFFFFLLLLC